MILKKQHILSFKEFLTTSRKQNIQFGYIRWRRFSRLTWASGFHEKRLVSAMWSKSQKRLVLNSRNDRFLPLKYPLCARAMWLSWLEHCPVHQKLVGLISGQGIYLGWGIDPLLGCIGEATDACLSLSFPHSCFSQINKKHTPCVKMKCFLKRKVKSTSILIW